MCVAVYVSFFIHRGFSFVDVEIHSTRAERSHGIKAYPERFTG